MKKKKNIYVMIMIQWRDKVPIKWSTRISFYGDVIFKVKRMPMQMIKLAFCNASRYQRC